MRACGTGRKFAEYDQRVLVEKIDMWGSEASLNKLMEV